MKLTQSSRKSFDHLTGRNNGLGLVGNYQFTDASSWDSKLTCQETMWTLN